MSFEFMNNPMMPAQNMPPQQPMNQPYYPVYAPQPINTMPIEDTQIVAGGYGFSILEDDKEKPNKHLLSAPVDMPETTTTARRGRKKKEEIETINPGDIIKAETVGVEDTPSIYNYMQTTNMLKDTLEQIDYVAAEIKEELDATRMNRTLKNKHNYIVGLAGNMVDLLTSRANVIKEINNAITKSIELDYRKEKDRKAADASANDDKYLMDLYTSFIRNPGGQTTTLAPTAIDTTVASIGGTGIIRSPMQQGGSPDQPADIGYLNYLNRLTPEQNMMYYEQDPNVKTVVVYDAATGNKFFQVMNVATGQVIPNVPVLDNRFMEDTYIDIKNRVATNNNLHETFPVIMINDNITKEY